MGLLLPRPASLCAPGPPDSCLCTVPTDRRVHVRMRSSPALLTVPLPVGSPHPAPRHRRSSQMSHQTVSLACSLLLTVLKRPARQGFSRGFLDRVRVPLPGAFQFCCNAVERLEAQPRPQRLKSQHFARWNIAEVDVRTKLLDQVGLLVLKRSLPDQEINQWPHAFAYRCHRFRPHCAVVVVDTDALAGLARFDRDPFRSPFEVLKCLLSQFDGCGLLCRVLLANLGDRCQPMIECTADHITPAMRR